MCDDRMTIEQKYKQLYANIPNMPVEVSDASNVYQCMDLAYLWIFILCYPKATIQHRYAFEVFTKASDLTRKYFDVIKNTPTGIPDVGSLLVFDRGTGIGSAGHISIVSKKTNSLMVVESLDQNWRKKPGATLVTHNYNKVLGWLTPKIMF